MAGRGRTVAQLIILASVFLLAKAHPDCTEISFRAAGHVLVGTAQGVLTTNDIDNCIYACMNSHRRFNFFCQSGVFYFHAEQHNCILNSENRNSRPGLYMADPSQKVEYFEVECASHSILKRQANAARNRNVLKLQTPEYGNWTMCDRNLLKHMRFRECKTLNPNNCQRNENGCDPAKEDQYDKEGGSSGGPDGQTPPPPTPGVPPDTTAASTDSTANTISPGVLQNRRRLPANATSSSSVRTGQNPADTSRTRAESPTASPTSATREQKKVKTFDGRALTAVKTQNEAQKSSDTHLEKNAQPATASRKPAQKS